MEDEARQVVRLEDQVGAEGHVSAVETDALPDDAPAMREPALLVIFAVVRQVGFRHHAQDVPARDHNGAIVEPPLVAQRRADEKDGGEIGARRHDLGQRGLARFEESGLQQQVVERVGRQAELGIDEEVDPGRIGPARLGEDRVAVEGDVRGPDMRRARTDPDEAVPVQCGEVFRARAIVHRNPSSNISTATGRQARRTPPRPSGPKCASRCMVFRPFVAQAKCTSPSS